MHRRRWSARLIWKLLAFANLAALCAVAALGAVRDVRTTFAHQASTGMAAMAGMHEDAPALSTTKPVLLLHRKQVTIRIHNFAFIPAKVTVSPGTRITWVNSDSDPHTVDSTKNVWTSEALDTDGRFSRSFVKTGAFNYYCSVHPFMHGEVIVQK